MPNTILDARVRSAYRARAVSAAIAVGAQVFATGAGVCVTISLNAAYLSTLPCLPLAALAAALCRRSLAAQMQRPSRQRSGSLARVLHILLSLLMLACCTLLLAAASNLAGQMFLVQAKVIDIVTLTLIAAALCALSGGTGVSRLCFALRFLLPCGLVVLTLCSISVRSPAGLFPLLGAGPAMLGASSLCALGACSPVMLLLLPPPELEAIDSPSQSLPGAWFFIWRILLGVSVGILLLAALSLCNTYETLRELRVWGARMQLTCSDRPREGLAQTLLVLFQLAALFMGSVSTLCAAERTVCRSFPALKKRRFGLFVCLLLLAVSLWIITHYGMILALRTAPLLLVPLLLILLLSKRM